MKIATWNIERPNIATKSRNQKILSLLQELDADILILTETNSIIDLGSSYSTFATHPLYLSNEPYYKEGENRTTIWTKYPAKNHFKTFDTFTSICTYLQTPFGDLSIYGTIIGIYGNRRANFKTDLDLQIADWKRISASGNMCIAGDFNISFGDNYYYTQEGRDKINVLFEELNITNLTASIPQNIDHIAISDSYMQGLQYKTAIWNDDKKLSDHIGICVSMSNA